ncbi:MAG TPA: hypothetical protein VF341_13860, partial [Anaeromyxobacteraceae bacterium]
PCGRQASLSPGGGEGEGHTRHGEGHQAGRGEGEPPIAGTWFRNYRGERYLYPEPPESDCSCPYDEVFFAGSGPVER